MVIVKLFGGLGNQMFQYAFGRSMALRRNDTLLFSTVRLDAPPQGFAHRRFGLDCFYIAAEPLTSEHMKQVSSILTVVQTQRGFCAAAMAELDHPAVMLEGGWQSERYFREYAPIIKHDFRLRRSLASTGDLCAIRSAINPVCVHVRRTDYMPKRFIGRDYYFAAFRRIKDLVDKPRFFVFSDDPNWCRREFGDSDEECTIVDSSHYSDHAAAVVDIELMTQCKHFVIANSTYSWWAAWLATTPEQVVIAPKNWYPHERNKEPGDLVPAAWTVL